MYYVYILQSATTSRYYIGSTKDVALRVARHNAGHNPSTKAYRPWNLIYSEAYNTLSEARRRENQIKSWKNPDYLQAMLGIGS